MPNTVQTSMPVNLQSDKYLTRALPLFIQHNEQDCIRSAQAVDDAGLLYGGTWPAVSLSISDTIR
jgi:hypothetical protein